MCEAKFYITGRISSRLKQPSGTILKVPSMMLPYYFLIILKRPLSTISLWFKKCNEMFSLTFFQQRITRVLKGIKGRKQFAIMEILPLTILFYRNTPKMTYTQH
jgi:hypothetical protein